MRKLFLIFGITLTLFSFSFAADTEVQDLTDITTPALGDDMYIVDDPDVTPASRKINIGNLFNVSPNLNSSGNTVGVDLSTQVTGTLPAANGGTGATSLTDGAVLLGSGTGAITATTLSTTEIMIGDGAGDPTFAVLSGDATMTNAGVVTVVDDLHAHTSTSLSGIDISADTNLAVTSPITLTGDTVGINDADDDGSTKGAASFDNTDFNAVSGNVTIVDDGHAHTGTSLSSIDISDDTNLAGGTNITLSGDTLNVDDAFLINDGDDTTSGTLTATGYIGNLYDAPGAVDLDIGSVDVTDVTVTTDGGAIILDGNITQDAGTILFMGGLLDTTGAVDMDYGSADITDHTFITDGTGTGEIVLPAQAIDSTEILNSTILAADMADADHGDVSWTSNVATVDNVAAANVAAGSLGSSVITSSVAEASVHIAGIDASGTTDSTTFLRGDGTWNAPAGSGDVVLAATQTHTGAKTYNSSSTFNGPVILDGIAGNSGQVFTSSGPGVAPGWTTSSGSDSNAIWTRSWAGSTLLATRPQLVAFDGIAGNFQQDGTTVSVQGASFDDSDDECRGIEIDVPDDVDTSGTAGFDVVWYSTNATSGSVQWFFTWVVAAEGEDWDQNLTQENAASDAAQGTAKLVTRTAWTETLSNLGWVAGDYVTGFICRDGDGTAGTDDFVGDAIGISFTIGIPRG